MSFYTTDDCGAASWLTTKSELWGDKPPDFLSYVAFPLKYQVVCAQVLTTIKDIIT